MSLLKGVEHRSQCGKAIVLMAIPRQKITGPSEWLEPTLTDIVLHRSCIHPKRRATGRDHVLFEHHRTEVIGPIKEGSLSDVGTLCYPGAHDVMDVVEEDP